MRIYTRTGDQGETSLFDGSRVSKDDLRVHAYGTVDELNSVIGLIRSEDLAPETDAGLEQIQCDLFTVGSALATPHGEPPKLDDRIGAFEAWIDDLTTAAPPLKSFVLPAGTREAALFHVARTVCRRAERLVCTYARELVAPADVLVYLNRLSDLLFALARMGNVRHGIGEVPWRGDAAPQG